MQANPPRALDGVRVLDLSRVLAGPWATQILGDLGAEVIKVEKPGHGDDTRAWGPPFAQGGDAAYFTCANRNKQSVAIDVARPEGAALVQRLARRAHVVVENFKVGGLAKYGLDCPSLQALNPALVYCSITGFGQTGPLADRPGYDYLIQAMGGLMSITGAPDDEPMKVGVAVADLFTGLYASVAILAALRHAERTGEGQHIDMALYDCQVAMLANQASNFFVSGEAPGRLGNAHPNIVPYQVFSASDGRLVIAVGNDGQFRSLCRVLGLKPLADDARFARNAQRVAHRAELTDLLARTLAPLRVCDVIAALETAGIPCGPINSIDQAFAHPQSEARKLAWPLQRGDGATIATIASPLRLERTPPVGDRAPPRLGQDTDAVLADILGLSEAERIALREAGVTG